MQPCDCLRRYPLFALLSPPQLDLWLTGGQELTYATGETVFQEGSAGVWAYLVLEGRVRIVRQAENGRELTLGTAGPGSVFGEYALLPPHRNTATCRAASPARLLRLSLLPLRLVHEALPGVRANLKNWLRLHATLHYLRDETFLGFMSAPSSLALLDRMQPAEYRPMHTIQADGLASDCWFVLARGQVCLHTQGSPYRELGPGDSFGEGALLGRDRLPVAVALTETRCLRLPRSAFAGSAGGPPGLSGQTVVSGGPAPRPAHAWVGQQEAADCGVAALAMIAQSCGMDVPVEVLRRRVRVGEHGASLLELRQAAVDLGLRAEAVRVSADQFDQVALPAVAHFSDGHYVVVYELGTQGVVVGDPATGVVRVSLEAFRQACSGKLLVVRPRKLEAGSLRTAGS